MMKTVAIYVADAGSTARRTFHWVGSRTPNNSSENLHDLADRIVEDLQAGRKVALGYESPLFIPCPNDCSKLGRARQGECQKETGNRPFSAGAGATVLATGIQSLAWILRKIKEQRPATRASTCWESFKEGDVELLVWEAFVSGSEKAVPASHVGDAKLAIAAFENALRQPAPASAIKDVEVFSLAGATILYANLSDEPILLRIPTLVLRPISRQRTP